MMNLVKHKLKEFEVLEKRPGLVSKDLHVIWRLFRNIYTHEDTKQLKMKILYYSKSQFCSSLYLGMDAKQITVLCTKKALGKG